LVYHGLNLPLEQIAALCRRHHIRRLALFGSILTDEFRPESDVDMVVEFEPGQTPGLEFFGIQRELGGLIGRPVDLRTPSELSRYFRDEVMAIARPIYAQE
jgi:predicted nucleotidyltransferase